MKWQPGHKTAAYTLASFYAVSTLALASGDDSTAEAEIGVDVLAFFVIVLVIGVATYHILAITRIPYTAMLLVWGVFLGIANETYDRNWKLIGPGTQAWQNIQPSLLLTGFLPVLLFAAAFGLEWQYIRRLFASSLLLAGPGVLLGASLTAVLVKYTFPYGWSWVQSLLFGAIFSATDPVAVVAVLKETGMPKKVRTLVDLEALLNDGSAYVLFTLLRVWAEGGHQNAGDSIKLAFRLTLGGPATGLAFGIAATLWLRFMFNKPLAEISLTLAAAYGTYIVGEQLFDVSPVLAVVFLGLWMAGKGFDHISRKVEHPLHVFWEELEFVANTLVFVLSGTVIAGRIYESANSSDHLIEATDWAYSLLLWVYLTIVRVLMFVICWPLLNAWGYVVSPREAVVLCWSGLRGAVGLSLALFVLLDGAIPGQRFRTLTFFHMGCVAFLTIVIQGTSMRPLLQFLGLTKQPGVKRAFLRHVLRQVEEHGERRLQLARYDDVLGAPDWRVVLRRAGLDPRLLAWQPSKLGSLTRADGEGDAREARLALKLDRSLLVREKRSRLLLAVRQTYNDFFHDQYITTSQVFRLRVSADKGLEELATRLTDWDDLKRHCTVPGSIRLAQRLTRRGGTVGRLAQLALALRLEDAATLAIAFCHSHQLAAQDLARYERLEEWAAGREGEPEETDGPLEDVLELMKRNVAEQVLLESREEVREAFDFVAGLRDAFPEVLRGVKTRQLAQEMLMYKEEYIAEIGQTGLLEDTELEQMLDLVEFKLSNLHFCPPRFTWPGVEEMLAAHPLFRGLDPAALSEQVMPGVQVDCYNEGDVIHALGETTNAASIVLRGSARLQPHSLYRNSRRPAPKDALPLRKDRVVPAGALLGCWTEFLAGSCPFRVTAASICLVARIPGQLLRELAGNSQREEDVIWQSIGVTFALMWGEGALAGFEYDSLVRVFSHARTERCEAGQPVHAAGSLMLMAGSLRSGMAASPGARPGSISRGPCLLSGGPRVFASLTQATVLHLPASLELAADQTGDRFSKSALAELVTLPGQHSKPSFDLSRTSAPEARAAGRGTAADPSRDAGRAAAEVAYAAHLQEAEASLTQNRRKSLAHGLHIHGLAHRSAPQQ